MRLERTSDPTRFWNTIMFIVAGIGLGLFVLLAAYLLLGSSDEPLTEADRTWAIATTTCLESNGVDIDPLSTEDLEAVVIQRDEHGVDSFPHDCGHGEAMGTGEYDDWIEVDERTAIKLGLIP